MASGHVKWLLDFHFNKWMLCTGVVRYRERERGDFLNKYWRELQPHSECGIDRGYFSLFVFIVKRGVMCAHVRVVRHRLVCSREREREREREGKYPEIFL